MKKYELTTETMEFYGRTLTRIRALINIDRFNVKAGDLGGWIESEKIYLTNSMLGFLIMLMFMVMLVFVVML